MNAPRKNRPARLKAVSYVLIPQTGDFGVQMYERLYAIIDAHHEELSRANVRVALAWATSWKPDPDGRMTLGKCKKASDLDRELAPFDFVILLNRDFWQNPRVTVVQQTALLDHELMHAAIAYDEHGEPKRDERFRTVYRLRKHDLEEFSDIAARYGCWKRDIEAFAQALARAERTTSSGWIGYSALHENLKSIGVDLSPLTIAHWSDEERREVMTWALIRQEADGLVDRTVSVTLSPTIPACLAAALSAPTAPDVAATH